MDLRQLKYFVVVAEHSSMTRAAAVLAVAQPVLSRQIRELEADLGVRLLSRNGRGVVLSEAGIRLLPRARALVRDADAARAEANELRDRPAGTVSVAMAPSVGAILWVPLLSELQRKYPDIRVQANEGYSGHVIDWIVNGKMDIGVIYQPQQGIRLNIDLLISEKLYLLGPPSAPCFRKANIDFAALADIPLILPGPQHAVRRLLEDVATRQHISLKVQLEVNAYPAIKRIVTGTGGYTVLPVAPILSNVRSGQIAVAEIVNPTLVQKVGLLTPSQHPISLSAQTVSRVIRELAAEFSASGIWPDGYIS